MSISSQLRINYGDNSNKFASYKNNVSIQIDYWQIQDYFIQKIISLQLWSTLHWSIIQDFIQFFCSHGSPIKLDFLMEKLNIIYNCHYYLFNCILFCWKYKHRWGLAMEFKTANIGVSGFGIYGLRFIRKEITLIPFFHRGRHLWQIQATWPFWGSNPLTNLLFWLKKYRPF